MKSSSAMRKFRFNLIDCILIAIILCAGVLLFRIFSSGDTETVSSKTNLLYQIEVTKVPQEFRGLIDIGDKVVDTVTLYSLGDVVDVTYADCVQGVLNEDEGKLVYATVPGMLSVTLTIRATADMQNGSYAVGGGYVVAVGKKIQFRVPDYTGTGYCTVLEEVIADE